MRAIVLFLVLCLSFIGTIPVQAQDFFPTQRTEERTRIQYQKFTWKFYASQNFEVYYIGKNEALALKTIQMLESDFSKITEVLSYTPFQKTKVFVYPSQSEYLQSNSGISLNNAEEVKEENLSKFRIEISFSENQEIFRKQLIREVANVYVHDMLFGGSIKDALQNSLLMSLPEWYLSGISAFIAEGDSPEMNQYMYQVVSSNKVRKPSMAKGQEAEWLGQSIWNYINKTYGRQPIGNILNLTRIIRNDQSSISSTLKKPFSKFLKEWFEFYLSEAKQYEVNTVASEPPKKILSKDLLDNVHIRQYSLSPDGQWVAYVLDDYGLNKVYIQQLKNNKSQLVLTTGLKDPMRASEVKGPLVYWGKGNSLAVLYQAEGKSWLQTFSALSASKNSIRLENKKNLGDWLFLDFEMSENAQRMLVRTLRNGQVDVGIFDLRRNRLTPITQDVQDESEAHWFGKGGDVLYVSDKYTDTIPVITNKEGLKSVYIWRADDPSATERLFTHRGSISNIRSVSDSIFYFLAEQGYGNELVAFHKNSKKFFVNKSRMGAWKSFSMSDQQVVFKDRDILTSQLQQIPFEILTSQPSNEWFPQVDENNSMAAASILSETGDGENSPPLSAREKRNAELKKARLERRMTLLSRKDPDKTTGPFSYLNSFVVNNSEGNFRIDPVRGLGYSFGVNMNDLLENHLIKTGIFVTANLKNSDIWAEYSYLAKKIDWVLRVDRKVLDQESESYSQKIRFNRFEVKGVYPFNMLSKLSLSGIFTSNRAFDQYSLLTPENLATYGGAKLEYTYDNTVYLAENLRTGFRMNASVEQQVGFMNPAGFTRVKIDARKYVKLSNSFILATRVSASQSMGDAARQTILGGMDNWIFINRDTRNKENPLGMQGIAQRDVFMSDFATSMRGFNINKLSGNSHLLVNVELRVPLKSLIGQEYSKSKFMNSFQFVGFGDIGSAWTGSNPFSRSNGFNTNVYGGNTNPFQVTVTDFRNPFLMGYGVGMRANLVGYFIKLDYAFGIENSEVKSPITYLTFGHDF